jgi:hypothetical protein
MVSTFTALEALVVGLGKAPAGNETREERMDVDSEIVVADVLYENLLRMSLTCAEIALLNILVSS